MKEIGHKKKKTTPVWQGTCILCACRTQHWPACAATLLARIQQAEGRAPTESAPNVRKT